MTPRSIILCMGAIIAVGILICWFFVGPRKLK